MRPRVVPGPLLVSSSCYLYITGESERPAHSSRRASVRTLGHNVSLTKGLTDGPHTPFWVGTYKTVQWVTAVEPMHACACSHVSEAPQ